LAEEFRVPERRPVSVFGLEFRGNFGFRQTKFQLN
jgi:hypothetical protein